MRDKNTLLKGRKFMFRDGDYRSRVQLEWLLFWKARSCRIGVEVNGMDDQGIMFFLAIPFLFSIYLGFDIAWINKRLPRSMSRYTKEPVLLPDNREMSLAIHHGSLWWNVWTSPDEWHSGTPRWRRGCFNPMDFVFGQRIYTEELAETFQAPLCMPEGKYKASGKVTAATWHRPRWPWWPLTIRMDCVKIEFAPPVPIPGKGTESYNCYDDKIYSMSREMSEWGIRDVLREFRVDTIKTRIDRGGVGWEPRKGWPVGEGGPVPENTRLSDEDNGRQ